MEEFKQLVAESHKQGMKIILEFPVNQVGNNHPWVLDPSKANWFHDENGNQR